MLLIVMSINVIYMYTMHIRNYKKNKNCHAISIETQKFRNRGEMGAEI